MSVDFSKLEYFSLYGSDYLIGAIGISIRVVGSLSSDASGLGTITLESGYPEGDEAAVALPNPTIIQYVMGDTPNDPTRWYDISNDPRPLRFPTSGGNINMTMSKYRPESTTSAPTATIFEYIISNPLGVSVTFDYTFRAAFYTLCAT